MYPSGAACSLPCRSILQQPLSCLLVPSKALCSWRCQWQGWDRPCLFLAMSQNMPGTSLVLLSGQPGMAMPNRVKCHLPQTAGVLLTRPRTESLISWGIRPNQPVNRPCLKLTCYSKSGEGMKELCSCCFLHPSGSTRNLPFGC